MIFNLYSRQKDFVSIIESGNKRYVLVVEDPIKAKVFLSKYGNGRALSDAMELHRKRNSDYDMDTKNALLQELDCGSGIAVFESDGSKMGFTRINDESHHEKLNLRTERI